MRPQPSTIPPTADHITISVFENVKGTAKDIALSHFIAAVAGHIPNRYAPVIAKLRAIDKETDKEAYRSIKSTLPAVTISCRCTPGQSHAHHDGIHTGVIAVDIDGADNPSISDWGDLRTSLGLLPYCYLSALSAGGRGVFLLLAAKPEQPQAMIWDALKRYFAESLKITIDPSCGNINRLRLLSYDPGAVVKNPATRFTALKRIPSIESAKSSSHGNNGRNKCVYTPHCGECDSDRIRAAVEVWSRRGIELNDYDDWLKAAGALHSLPDGAELFDAVSRHGRKYDPNDTAEKFRLANLTRITPASFIYLCRKYGISDHEINEAMSQFKALSSSDQQAARLIQ